MGRTLASLWISETAASVYGSLDFRSIVTTSRLSSAKTWKKSSKGHLHWQRWAHTSELLFSWFCKWYNIKFSDQCPDDDTKTIGQKTICLMKICKKVPGVVLVLVCVLRCSCILLNDILLITIRWMFFCWITLCRILFC
jgi:hypothetical protein